VFCGKSDKPGNYITKPLRGILIRRRAHTCRTERTIPIIHLFFQIEQIPFGIKAAGITGKAAVPANHPMAGNDNRDGVTVVGHTDSPVRTGPSYKGGYITVAPGFSGRNSLEGFPDGTLKIRTAYQQGELKLSPLSVKILKKLGCRLFYQCRLGYDKTGHVFFAEEDP
jgi:hypothetical protein